MLMRLFLCWISTLDDHSRVPLRKSPGAKKENDYINANYIDGYCQSRAFIGTQGPLPCTFDSFWKMIWEQQVSIIVMITNLVERGRRKCDMYWPKEGVENYGVIQVKLVREDVMATYTVRTFQIRHMKLKKKKKFPSEKFVYQYHYTNWPDHGTPDQVNNGKDTRCTNNLTFDTDLRRMKPFFILFSLI